MIKNTKEAKRYVLAVEIDQYELACRLLEAAGQIKRPKGATAKQAFDSLDSRDQGAWMRAAQAAAEYFRDVVNESRDIQ